MTRSAAPLDGYLQRLAEQVRPEAPTLRRRRPALFEPAPGEGPRHGEGGFGELQAEPERPADPAGRPATAPSSPVPSAAPGNGFDHAPAAWAPATRARVAVARGDSATASQPAGSAAQAAPPPAAAMRREREHEDRGPRVLHAGAAGLISPPAAAVRPRVDAPIRLPSAMPAAPIAPAAPIDRERLPRMPDDALPARPARLAPVAPAAAPPGPRHVATLSMEAQARPRASPRPGPRVAAAAPARMPVPLPPVEVVIGRIEVRIAAPPPAAARATGKSAPRKSLEQYLRDRHGGRE